MENAPKSLIIRHLFVLPYYMCTCTMRARTCARVVTATIIIIINQNIYFIGVETKVGKLRIICTLNEL